MQRERMREVQSERERWRDTQRGRRSEAETELQILNHLIKFYFKSYLAMERCITNFFYYSFCPSLLPPTVHTHTHTHIRSLLHPISLYIYRYSPLPSPSLLHCLLLPLFLSSSFFPITLSIPLSLPLFHYLLFLPINI